MKIGELFVQLGVKADTFTVKDFGRAIADIPLAAAGAIVSLGGLSLGFAELTKHTLDISNNLGVFRDETGLSIEELQRWTGVAKQVGISGDAVQSSIMGITNALAQLRLGNGAALLPLGRLGVDVRGKNAIQVLQEIGKNSQHMDPNVARQLMGQLGVSPEMMRIFALGPGQFNRMASQGVVMNSKEQQAMQEFQEAIGKFTLTIEKDFVPVLVAFEPYMKDLTEVMAATLAKAGGIAGYAIGETAHLLNAMRKQGGFSAFMENLANAGLTADELRDPRYVNNEFGVTQHITSTADAHEVARISAEHMKREHTKAQKQFNNGGY